MGKFFSIAFIFISAINGVSSQQLDTVKIMSYNLLNYRNTTTYCTNSNNNTSSKESYLTTIVEHVNPDVIVCNEIGANFANGYYLMQNSLNVNGVSHWAQANYFATSGSSLSNMLYFNTTKLGLASQDQIERDTNNSLIVRLIDVYRLYYKQPNMNAQTDTVFFTVLAAHLKASNTAADRLEREKTTAAVMKYLDDNNLQGNVFICGDFNVYSGSEGAFQNLINYTSNPSVRFFDPINAIGSWNNNSSFSYAHTQSVRSSSNGCAAGGGMDDRFDFTLVSDEVLNNVDRMKYITNSYSALGQDGNRFNGNINSPLNTLVPVAVANALYNMSDHLPVISSYEIDYSIPTGVASFQNNEQIRVVNPINAILAITKEGANFNQATIQLFDMNGRLLIDETSNQSSIIRINTSFLQRGAYILKVYEGKELVKIQKLIKI
jgi:hypothetical protein